MKTFDNEFDKFKDMLLNKENFAFARFSDGECFILQNKRLILGDNFFVTGDHAGHGIYGEEERKDFNPDTDQKDRKLLKDAYNHSQHNYFKGVPSFQDRAHIDFEFIDNDDLTFANLWINANYKRFIKEIVEEIFPNRDIIYVVNERAGLLQDLPFKVKKDFRIGSNCFKEDQDVIGDMKNYLNYHNTEDHIILCSAASLSNLIIQQCYEEFPNNTYLDIGSTLNPYLGENMQSCMHTRDYLRSYWKNEKTHYGEQVDVWDNEN